MACGIFALVVRPGFLREPIGAVIKKGLKKLEYRGYDSVGFAVIDYSGRLVVRKSKGSIDAVSLKLKFDNHEGLVGIGHTRWATHGVPSDINSHPHTDCGGSVAVVHNGIIENYREIREWLRSRGHVFTSETDTEVVPHLIEEYKKGGLTTYEALKRVAALLKGAYALAVLDAEEPEKIFFLKHTSPLIIGLGNGANFLASDIPAFLEYTRRVIVLRDGELGYITPDDVRVERVIRSSGNDPSSIKVETEVVRVVDRVKYIDWTPEMAEKGGYPHFMIKEIHEQPQAIASTISGFSKEVEEVAKLVSEARRVVLVGAGTSYHASFIGALMINSFAGTLATAVVSSEARWFLGSLTSEDVLIAVSQSGETIDTLLAVREAKKLGAKTVALSNVIDSAIPRESDISIYTRAGPEIGVAATKTFTTQVTLLTYLALLVGRLKGRVDSEEFTERLNWIKRTPRVVSRIISSLEARVRHLSVSLRDVKSIFYLGRGLGYGISMEGALKMKEIAYIHAEAYPAGESKHGPIALVEEGFPVIFTAVSPEEAEMLQSNVEEMRARGARLMGVGPPNAFKTSEDFLAYLQLPAVPVEVAAITYVIPHQLLAYYTAVSRGLNPDRPRNLAKTVTVV